jgi:hypothetical protein
LVNAPVNWPLPQAKIAYLPQPPPYLPPCAMQQENPRSFTAAKEISASALQLPSAYLVYVILCRSVHHSQCKQVLLRKFYWLGKIQKKFTAE